MNSYFLLRSSSDFFAEIDYFGINDSKSLKKVAKLPS